MEGVSEPFEQEEPRERKRTNLGDVDTVKELADILVLDEARSVDGGGRLGDVVDVVTFEDDLVLYGDPEVSDCFSA